MRRPLRSKRAMISPVRLRANASGFTRIRVRSTGLSLGQVRLSGVAALKHTTLDRAIAEEHYAEHQGKPFFEELVTFITSGPLVALVLEGQDAVKAARQVIGATNPLEAAPGSIRGDFAIEVGQNMVHGSDSPESAEREANLFFPQG